MSSHRLVVVVLLGSLFGVACETSSPAPNIVPTEDPATPPRAAAASEEGEPPTAASTSAVAHDPANPPIDCPLHAQGVDPTHMRPFEEVAEYIAFLERADRAAWQRPDEVVDALELDGDETVFDLGAGSGYFTFRFADALPHGQVIAADTEPEMIRHVHHNAMTRGLNNVQVQLIEADEPGVPGEADVVFVCDVLHHVAQREAWLSRVADAMQPGARLVLIEFKEGDLPEGPPEAVKIPRDRLVELATGAGLQLTGERAGLLPYQTFLVFTKPAG